MGHRRRHVAILICMTNAELLWEITRLLVAVLVALGAIYLRFQHERKRERQALQETVWRSITDEPEQYQNAFEGLQRIVEQTRSGKVATIMFDLPRVTNDAAYRLSQLDPERALNYATYISFRTIANDYLARLHDLLREYFKTTDTLPPARLASAIELYAEKIGQVLSAEMDCDLKLLHKLNSRNCSRPRADLLARTEKVFREIRRWPSSTGAPVGPN